MPQSACEPRRQEVWPDQDRRAFGVTCGVSFIYGGLRIGNDGQVLDDTNRPLPGLSAARVALA